MTTTDAELVEIAADGMVDAADDAPIDRDALARVLFEQMEQLEPTEGGEAGWAGLTDRQRDFYRLSVGSVLEALGFPGRRPPPPPQEPSMTTLERLARAMRTAYRQSNVYHNEHWREWYPHVRALLLALREPDEAMLQAMSCCHGPEVWRRGVDAILSDTPPTAEGGSL